MFRESLQLVAIVALVTATALGTSAQDVASVEEIVARMASDPHQPEAYSASVKLHVRLHVFPFIALTLNGKTTYRRPGLYHFVFRGVPRAAEKFDDLRYDLGGPLSWSQRYELTLAPQSTHDAPVIRLTPKNPGLVSHLDVFTEAQMGRIVKAVWSRRDGGTISLVQTYKSVGDAFIVERQVATIHIPHMRADVTANYTGFALETPLVAAGP